MNPERNQEKKDYSLFDNNSIKVIIIGSLAIVCALLVMSFTSFTIMKEEAIKKLKDHDLKILADSIGMAIEDKIDKAVDSSVMLANDPLVMNWVNSNEKDLQEKEEVRSKMKTLVENLDFDTAFLANNRTLHYWNYHQKTFALLNTLSKTNPYDKWFFNFINKKVEYELNIDYNKELNDTFVWINARGGGNGQPAVAAGVGIDLSQEIKQLIQEDAKTGTKNDIWLADDTGTIYLSKNKTDIKKNVKTRLPVSLVKSIYKKNSPETQFTVAEYTNQKGTYDIAYKRIKNTEWRLIIQIPRSESLKFLDTIKINTIISCIIIIILMVITFYLVSNRIANPYKRAMQLNEELENMVALRTKELHEKNTQIQDSLDYAKKIQHTIFPADSDLKKYLKEYFLIFEPKEAVGGDFYWIRSFEDGILLIVGDCTGHGVPGALMATAANAMLNQISDEVSHNNPAAVLMELDRLLKQSFQSDGNEEIISDGLDAAVLYISNSREMLFAGSNMSLILSKQEDISEIKGDKWTIDYSATIEEKNFQNRVVDYMPSSMIYLVTDGFKDQPGGERKLPFGKSRLMELLKNVSRLEIEEQRTQILLALKAYEAEEIRRDDVTMIGFRIS